jgi:hypothetical protein
MVRVVRAILRDASSGLLVVDYQSPSGSQIAIAMTVHALNSSPYFPQQLRASVSIVVPSKKRLRFASIRNEDHASAIHGTSAGCAKRPRNQNETSHIKVKEFQPCSTQTTQAAEHASHWYTNEENNRMRLSLIQQMQAPSRQRFNPIFSDLYEACHKTTSDDSEWMETQGLEPISCLVHYYDEWRGAEKLVALPMSTRRRNDRKFATHIILSIVNQTSQGRAPGNPDVVAATARRVSEVLSQPARRFAQLLAAADALAATQEYITQSTL